MVNDKGCAMLPPNTTWAYDKCNNSLIPVGKGGLKVRDIVVTNGNAHWGRFVSTGFVRVTKVWYDEYGQMCWTSIDYDSEKG